MYVKWPLDREDRNLYTINVTASDGLFVSQATVEVTVIDTNDNSPICDQVGNKTSNCFFQRTDASMVSVKYVEKMAVSFSLLHLFDSAYCWCSHCQPFIGSCHSNDRVFALCLCLQAVYTASIPEDLPIGSVLLRVGATDEDAGISAWIQYSLHGPGSQDFGMDPDTGMDVALKTRI